MRTKTIIDGFKNSQKFRFILQSTDGAEVGMVITIQQMSDCFATRGARIAVWEALMKLGVSRRLSQRIGESMPTGIVTNAEGFRQVQVDLH